jgi:hypothetical protein
MVALEGVTSHQILSARHNVKSGAIKIDTDEMTYIALQRHIENHHPT